MRRKLKKKLMIMVLLFVGVFLYAQHQLKHKPKVALKEQGVPISVWVPQMIKDGRAGQTIHSTDWKWASQTIRSNRQKHYVVLGRDGPDALNQRILVNSKKTGSIIMKKDIMRSSRSRGLSSRVPEGFSAFLLKGHNVDATPFYLLASGDWVNVYWQDRYSSKKVLMFKRIKVLEATAISVILSLQHQQAMQLDAAKKIGRISLVVQSDRENDSSMHHEETAESMQDVMDGAAQPIIHIRKNRVTQGRVTFAPSGAKKEKTPSKDGQSVDTLEQSKLPYPDNRGVRPPLIRSKGPSVIQKDGH